MRYANKKANTACLQPKDRNYKKHDKPREPRLEVKGDGIAHALRSQALTTKYFVVIEYEEGDK